MNKLLHDVFAAFSRRMLNRSLTRRLAGPLPRTAEILEERTLLSAVTDGENANHVDDFDIFGNEYDALTVLPDEDFAELGSADGTGDFDGTGTTLDLSQTFFLHSNPGATHTIYLDFDGHLTSGTSWNSAFTGGADFYTAAYSFEGDASFSNNELARIQAIWQRVAEDFLPFDVNVTTQDPGAAALSKSGSGDGAWGVRVVIGGNGSWYGSGYGGVAYRNSFNYSNDTPCFVFEDNLGNGHDKYTAEAVSHEVGHTLGLAHDGSSTTSYYQGHGSGETGWATIMGVGYYQNLSQWSKGEYSGANNTQDDLAIITSQNGFGYRADDVGNTDATAGTLFASAGIVQDSGIIERSSDVDVYVFATGAGTVSFQGLVAGRGANLDLLLELYDAGGRLVASANPSDQLNAGFSVSVGAGIYYLHVSGVGKGDPLGSGYSDYGSIGSYRLSGSIVESTEVLPTYLAISPANVDQNEGNSGSTAFSFTIQRSGDSSTGVSVGWIVTGNTANAADFAGGVLPAGTVSFAAGETSKTITIYVAGDLAIESDETFTVTLLNASAGAEITTGSAQGTIRNDDQPGVFVSAASGLTTSESGQSASFSVVLTHPPTANVVIAVTSQNTAEGTVSVSQLVFTPANWNIAQTVTVTGVDDSIRDGNEQYVVTLGPIQSSDPNYNGLDPVDVQLTNQDNEKGKPGRGGDSGGNTKGGKGSKGPSAAEAYVLPGNSGGRGSHQIEDSETEASEETQSPVEAAGGNHSNPPAHAANLQLFTRFGELLGDLL